MFYDYWYCAGSNLDLKYIDSVIYGYCCLIIDASVSSSNHMSCKKNKTSLECFEFIKNKIRNSSFYIQLGLISLTVLFNFLAFLRFGAGFSNLNAIQKDHCYTDFKTSRLSFKRDLLKFYQSFIVLYFYQSS